MAVKKTATRSKEYSESIIDTVREPLIILDHDLRVVTASRSFYDFFKVKPEETVGQLIYDLGNKQWDIPKLRELLENILPQKTTFDNYEVEHIFAAVGRRVMLLNARQIQRVSGKERIILLAIEDITERKWAESQRETALELLQESKERYRALFDRSLDLVCVIDFEGRFIDANNAALNRFGYTKEEIHSLNFTSLLSEDQLPLAFKALQDIQEAGNQQELAEFKLRHKNGSDVYVETIGSTIMSDGIPVAIQLIARDITERKRAEKELNDSEQRFSAIFRYSLACISLTRISDGKFLDVNDAFLRMTGYKREEIIGSTALDLNLWNDPECRAKVVAQLSEQGRSPGAETTWRRKSGKIIDVIVEADVIDVGGEKYILGLVNDITERKRAEKNLVYLSRQNELILTSVAEGILGLDLEGNHIFVNPAAERMLGCKVEELIGSPGHSTWHHTKPNGSPYPRAECKILATILEGTVHHVSTEIFWRKDGTSFPVEYTSTPIYEEGRKAGVVLTFADITERKQIEEKLSKSEIKYRSILENIQEGYFEIDLAGNFTFFNDSMRRLYGYSKEELMGMNYRQYADKEAAKKNFQAFNKIYTTGETIQEFNWQAIRKGGDKIYAELSASLQKDSSGKPIGFSGIVRDITERKQAEEELRLSEEKYRTFIETIQDGYYEIDLTGKYTFVNDMICKHLQYSKEELIGKENRQYQTKENAKKAYQKFAEVLITGNPIKAFEMEVIRKDGTIQISEISISLVRDTKGNPIAFRGTSRDITERKLMEEKLKESENKYRLLADNVNDVIFVLDMNLNYTYISPSVKGLRGYEPEELMKLSARETLTPASWDLAARTLAEVMELEKSEHRELSASRTLQLEMRRKDGTTVWTEAKFSIIRDENQQPVNIIGLTRDITERKKMEETLQGSKDELEATLIEMQYLNEKAEHLATHDTLTGLPNRSMFSQQLNYAIKTAQRYQRQFAVLFIDLDRFKIINDTLGHEAGDQLLQEIAARLTQSLRAVDVVGRLGGDEFVILIEEVSDSNQVAAVAHKILTSVIKPINLMGQESRITASIGISMYPKDAQDEQTLMKNADIAMYLAKEEGKNNYQFFSKDIQSKSLEHLSIETNLRFALERNELSLHYQAKVDFNTDLITGVEALLRWQNPYLGSVTPTQFIPVAEETGLIVPIGRWVLKTACAQNVAWQKQGLPAVCMAVNLSLRQLTDENLIDDISTALNDSGMAPNLLELEITESMVMHNPAHIFSILSKIKSMGVRLAIDDFGTGYSSLAKIKHFPVDTLKIDRSFIRNIPEDAEDKAITEAIIAMGKTLSLTVVAEGVETEEQMNFLKEHSCDEMQGFYFSKPVLPEQFADLLREHVPAPPEWKTVKSIVMNSANRPLH